MEIQRRYDEAPEALGLRPAARVPTLGQRLRQLREQRGLTQSQLVEGICGRTYVSQIEQDKRFPAPRVLHGLAQRLDVALESLATPYLASPMAGVGQCLALARELARAGAVRAAEEAFEIAAERFERAGELDSQAANVLETLAVIRSRQGRLQHAISLAERALDDRLRLPSRRFALAAAYYRLGMLRLHRQDREGALNAILNAFGIILPLNPHTAPERTETVTALHEQVVQALAYLFLQSRDFSTARMLYRWAAGVWSAYDILRRPSPQLRLGQALAEMGVDDFDSAERLLSDLLADERDLTTDLLVHVHTNLGVLSRLRFDWTAAEQHQLTAWRLHRQSGEGDARAICNELARCALEVGSKEDARQWLQRAAEPDDAGNPVLVAETHLLAARAATMDGRLGDAARRLDRAGPPATDVRSVQLLVGVERVRLALLGGDRDAAHRMLETLRVTIERSVL